MKKKRLIKYNEAILEATDQLLEENKNIIVMGLGVTDPLGVFGTTKGLSEKYPNQVIETPTAENATMGVAIGSSLVGMRPIVTHQRVEFALLAIEQITNQAAKWHYMTGGAMCVPIVIRLIIGRGWGQGPQHSQSLDPWFAHIPGLKVVAPATPNDAKGLLVAAVRDNNPVVILEHRWLHNTVGNVRSELFETKIGKANIVRRGGDLTLVTYSYMLTEALNVADILSRNGVSLEVIDLRSHRPLDIETVFQSVKKTGHLITLDNGWTNFGIGSEVISSIVRRDINIFKSNPSQIGIKDVPIPSTRALANLVYPSQIEIINAIEKQLKCKLDNIKKTLPDVKDIPNKLFSGPF